MAQSVEQARRAWRGARTFAELCELGARFLEGGVAFFPGWGAPDVDEETDALVPGLAALSRAGFLTCASQPGHGARPGHDGRSWQRRAFVSGFVAPSLAARLGPALAAAQLTWCTDPDEEPMPVGLRGSEAFLFAGAGARDQELELFAEALSSGALSELEQTLYVSAVDPAWEERPRLWDTLSSAL
ncbi:MAG: hypothetical protein GY711_06480 [bacterium]|nr:hypothetical protein [bacterium]